MNYENPSIHSITSNSLLVRVEYAAERVNRLKSEVREFYYRVMLSQYPCPACGAKLRMDGPSKSVCIRGHIVDPTAEFQRSDCCGAVLNKKRCHYACSKCGKVAVSNFLFDERVFDSTYFSGMMQQSRERRRKRIAELKELLAGARSRPLMLAHLPKLEEVPGLIAVLDSLVEGSAFTPLADFREDDLFDMEAYRRVILACIDGASIKFSTVPTLCENLRKDRARRFVTLVFMEHERQVDLTQYGNDILVEKHEADVEG